ncbi:hypothetical protein ANANG_G00129170 [Anguilla anguilla]|uniref:Neuronal tyrosine-phosphorylated phosphoinositide-3-kinase adapter N-terminal domain-containing protein n=1 Tax=Anguilla anguilla TaxID=7936 RepID=A0A9D3MK93_ANGAN|nr:hypothetical protein ANANG_G00129170 [Anguilla anguilla]
MFRQDRRGRCQGDGRHVSRETLPHGLHDDARPPGPAAPPLRDGLLRALAVPALRRGGDEDSSPTSRKQPPPKPRRDPSTKLSVSSETVYPGSGTGSGTGRPGKELDKCDGSRPSNEDLRRVPPPKPKRNPNTQLSTSFDESYIRNHASSCCWAPRRDTPPPLTPSPARDAGEDEPVYIEMVGSTLRDPAGRGGAGRGRVRGDEVPLLRRARPRRPPLGPRGLLPLPVLHPRRPGRRRGGAGGHAQGLAVRDPLPFPNLLSHRPPLLVFPPSPAQCSPNSDESPLTPLDVTKLPVLENVAYVKAGASPTSGGGEPQSSALSSSSSSSSSSHRKAERELPSTHTITASGRSSAPPSSTLYKAAAAAHGYPRSHSACPSPASAVPHSAKGSAPLADAAAASRLSGSVQNVSRSRTPTSPLDELTSLFTTGRNMLKKSSGGRKSKEPAESECDAPAAVVTEALNAM